MGRPASISRSHIESAALEIVRTQGIDALSMRSLAERLGVTAASLYGHVKNRAEIVAIVQAAGIRLFGDGFVAAGLSIRKKALFYRQWALENPRLYPLVFQEFLHREFLPPGLENEVLTNVLVALGRTHEEARVRWALVHGLVDLERHRRFPAAADLTATWEAAIALLEAS